MLFGLSSKATLHPGAWSPTFREPQPCSPCTLLFCLLLFLFSYSVWVAGKSLLLSTSTVEAPGSPKESKESGSLQSFSLEIRPDWGLHAYTALVPCKWPQFTITWNGDEIIVLNLDWAHTVILPLTTEVTFVSKSPRSCMGSEQPERVYSISQRLYTERWGAKPHAESCVGVSSYSSANLIVFHLGHFFSCHNIFNSPALTLESVALEPECLGWITALLFTSSGVSGREPNLHLP